MSEKTRNGVFKNEVIETNGNIVSYLIGGDGPCIVFLHGYMETKEIWIEFANRFISTNKILIVDLPGHGESTLDVKINTMENISRVIYQVLSYNNIDKAIFIGHSMGGYVALAFLELFLSMTKALVLLNSITVSDDKTKLKDRLKEIYLLNKGKKELLINFAIPNSYHPERKEYFKVQISNTISKAHKISKENVIAHIKGTMLRHDRSYLLKSSNIPYIILHGKDDTIFERRVLINEKSIHKSNFVLLNDCSHMSFIEKSEDVFGIIKKFMRKIE